jgi:hypothetical protein
MPAPQLDHILLAVQAAEPRGAPATRTLPNFKPSIEIGVEIDSRQTQRQNFLSCPWICLICSQARRAEA